jgi:hypothetical protein
MLRSRSASETRIGVGRDSPSSLISNTVSTPSFIARRAFANADESPWLVWKPPPSPTIASVVSVPPGRDRVGDVATSRDFGLGADRRGASGDVLDVRCVVIGIDHSDELLRLRVRREERVKAFGVLFT